MFFLVCFFFFMIGGWLISGGSVGLGEGFGKGRVEGVVEVLLIG